MTHATPTPSPGCREEGKDGENGRGDDEGFRNGKEKEDFLKDRQYKKELFACQRRLKKSPFRFLHRSARDFH